MKLLDAQKRFYKGNLHTHTTRSDGRKSPEDVMALYAANGYDFLALTDHWKVGSEAKYENMLVLPGVEYDFTFDTQVLHLVSLFRRAEDAQGIERGMPHTEVIRRVNACGGVPVAAHPAWSLNTPDFLKSLTDVHLAEIYNTVSGEPFNAPRADSSGILDVTCANGKPFYFVASDDSHFYQGEHCVSYIMLQADELTVPAILDALRAGRFYASQGPRIYELEVTDDAMIVRHSPAARCTFLSNAYWVGNRCRINSEETETVYRFSRGENYFSAGSDRFVRCVLTDENGRRAFTSPYVIPKW